MRDLRDFANTEVLEASPNQLNEAVHTYRIRLRGTLDRSKPPVEIDQLEQQFGVLDVWENTLTCDGGVYRDIRCYKYEVEQEIARRAGTVPTQEAPVTDVSPPPEGEPVPVANVAETPVVPPKVPPPSDKDLKGFVAEFIEKTRKKGKTRRSWGSGTRPKMAFEARHESACV